MPKIVFACKSNSCRSQMAEGWANTWLDEREAYLSNLLKITEKKDTKTSSQDDMEHNEISEWIDKQRDYLSEAIIESVALDSSAVFSLSQSENPSASGNTHETCCGDKCASSKERKSVKEKAVRAMADCGVDISGHFPKTVEEVLPSLTRASTISTSTLSTLDNLSDDDGDSVLSLEKNEEKRVDAPERVVDKLVILCSCGDEMKEQLVRRSISVEEWNVDAPTQKMKAGEKNAYRRVSMEIKNEVYGLMDDLFRVHKSDSEFLSIKEKYNIMM